MKILIGALFLSLWQSLLFWKQDLGISVLLFTIPIIWITTKLLKGNIKNKKALLISIPIIVLSSTYFIFDNLTFYLINIVLIPILYLIMIIWAISDFQIKSIIYKIILMIFEPLNYIGDVIKTVLKEFNPKEKDEQIGEKKEKNNIFKAVCFTGIIALIVIGLLCSADNEFAKIFSTIFKDINIFNVSELTGRIIIIIIAFFYFAGFFMNMLDKENGLKEFEKVVKNIDGDTINKDIAFRLYDTFGFPIELTEELAGELGLKVDTEGFKQKFAEHQEKSRKGSTGKFKGGLASTGEMETKYHTATHLLNAALKKVLGPHVHQKGSNITAERMRFDFSHPAKMTDEEKKQTEDLVNEYIKMAIPVEKLEMKKEDALKMGAEAMFIDKYGDIVSVYKIGDVSLELCGGPHVKNTSELGHFKIKKEEASSAGVRRIKAILE